MDLAVVSTPHSMANMPRPNMPRPNMQMPLQNQHRAPLDVAIYNNSNHFAGGIDRDRNYSFAHRTICDILSPVVESLRAFCRWLKEKPQEEKEEKQVAKREEEKREDEQEKEKKRKAKNRFEQGTIFNLEPKIRIGGFEDMKSTAIENRDIVNINSMIKEKYQSKITQGALRWNPQ